MTQIVIKHFNSFPKILFIISFAKNNYLLFIIDCEKCSLNILFTFLVRYAN